MKERIGMTSGLLSRIGTALSMIGSALGFGSIWRFPQQVAQNGGLAFLLIYIISGVLFACPIFVIEFMAGQLSQGTMFDGAYMTNNLKFCFVGAAALVALGVNTYYPSLLAYVGVYLVHFNSQPWYPQQTDFDMCARNQTSAVCAGAPPCPSQDYCDCTWNIVKEKCVADMFGYAAGYFNEVTNPNPDFSSDFPSDGWGYATSVNWELYGILVGTSTLVALSVMFGDTIMKYVIYATLVPSFVIVLGLWGYNFSLDGMSEGMSYYAGKFEARQLINISVIRSGITQIVFALSVGTGVIPALASMNSIGDSIGNPSWIIVVSSVVFGVISGCIVFSMLGYLAEETGQPVSDGEEGGLLKTGGSGLIFITYSSGISNLFNGGTGAKVLHFFFWLMLYIMGFTSVVSLAKGSVSFFSGTTLGERVFGSGERGKRKSKFGILAIWYICMVAFGIINASDYGIYLVKSIDTFVGTLMMPLAVGLTGLVFTWAFNPEWYEKNYGKTLRMYQNMFLCFMFWLIALSRFLFTNNDITDAIWLVLSLVVPFIQPFVFAIFVMNRNGSSYNEALDLSWNGAFGDVLDRVRQLANMNGDRPLKGGTFRIMAGLVRNMVVPVIISIVIDTVCTPDYFFNYSPTQNVMPPWFALATYFIPLLFLAAMFIFFAFPELVKLFIKPDCSGSIGLLLKEEFAFGIFKEVELPNASPISQLETKSHAEREQSASIS